MAIRSYCSIPAANDDAIDANFGASREQHCHDSVSVCVSRTCEAVLSECTLPWWEFSPPHYEGAYVNPIRTNHICQLLATITYSSLLEPSGVRSRSRISPTNGYFPLVRPSLCPAAGSYEFPNTRSRRRLRQGVPAWVCAIVPAILPLGFL